MGCHSFLQGVFPTQGSNPGLLNCRQILYHLSHQGSPFPALRSKKKPKVRDRFISGLMHQGSHMSEAWSWIHTPPCAVVRVQDLVMFFPSRGRRLPVLGELMSSWLIDDQGNQQVGTCLIAPLTIIVENPDLSLKPSLAGTCIKCVGKSVMQVGCRLSRHWSSSVWTESKKIAILSGLTMHL